MNDFPVDLVQSFAIICLGISALIHQFTHRR